MSKDFLHHGQQLAVLRDITLYAAAGEFVSMIGPSGCGKSTLLNMLAGLEQPASGTIALDGHDTAPRLGRVGYMPQKDLLLPWRTMVDNVILGLEIQGVSRRVARLRALTLMEQFGLKGFETAYPASLSGGMRQRAAFLRTLLPDHDVLLLDEPFGALDALNRTLIQAWLLQLWDTLSKTIILVTHDVDEAIFLADRVYVMTARPGRIKLCQPIDLPRPRHLEMITSAPFVALKASGISRPRDLVGKKVGYPGIPTNEPLLATMLKTDGARGLQDVALVNVGFDLVPALIGKQVDAVVGAYWTQESIVLENQGHAVNIMRMEQSGVPDYYELVLVTSEQALKSKPDVLSRFVRAIRKGYEEAAHNPQAGVDILLKGTKAEVDEKIERPGATLLAPLWKTDTTPFGTQEAAKWEGFTRWMQANGLLGPQVKAADAFTMRFMSGK